MAILPILTYPHPKLSEKATPAEIGTPETQQIIQDLLDTGANMSPDSYAGLASTQLGLMRRIIHLNIDGAPKIIINPEIIDASGKMTFDEGCLSLPGLMVPLTCSKRVTVRYQDEQGQSHEIQAEGDLLCACLQHEIDHLNGILMINRLSAFKRQRAIKKLEKYSRHQMG